MRASSQRGKTIENIRDPSAPSEEKEQEHDAQLLNDNSIKNPMPYNTEISTSINRAAFFPTKKNVGERVGLNGLPQLSLTLTHSFVRSYRTAN